MPRDVKPILCVGSATVDNIYALSSIPDEATKVQASDFHQISAGMAASAAAAIVRLGGRASFCGRIGDDLGGQFFREDMVRAGVDVSPVLIEAGRTTTISSIMIDARGERLVCSFQDPDMTRDPSALNAEFIAQFGTVLVDVRWPEAAERCLRLANRTGIPSILDADIAENAVFEALVPLATHPVFSEPAFLKYTGAYSIDDAFANLPKTLSGFVGVTLGANGVRWRDAGKVHSCPPPDMQVVDTLAAGDVFHGAFALAICEGQQIAQAARFATVAATLKCTRFGGRLGTPDRDEVNAVLQDSAG